MKKISIIGTVGIPAKYGGFETLVEYLTKYLNQKLNITVFCSAKVYSKQYKYYNGVELKYINLNANGIESIPYDIISIFKALKNSDTLLILGVSGCVILPFVKKISNKKIIVNIDGLEWKREKWNKLAKLFLKFSEKMAVKYADYIIADNIVIKDYIKKEYNKKSIYIPYGADHVFKTKLSLKLLNKYLFLKEKYAFSVCRIEPENNIHLILEAFSKYQNLNLVIIGNWDNSDYGKMLKKKYGKFNNIFLLDQIYDQNILNQIRSNCYIYIHGHSAGGTNPSLVEAMYLNLPIVAYDVDYNKATTHHKALYFNSKEELLIILQNLSKINLTSVGETMSKIARENYTWEKVAAKYLNILK